jgi:hypothetical protein
MAYLGNAPAEKYISFERQVFTIVNSQTAYTLSHSVTNENDIRLVVNNVVQEPGSGKAYTASGTTLTLSAALTNGTDEMYCVFLGRAVGTVNAPAGSVGTAQLAADAVTTAKVADGAITSAKLASGVGGVAGITSSADANAITITDAELVQIKNANDTGGYLSISDGDSGATANSNATDLVIENNGSAGISILTFNNAAANIYFGDGQDDDAGRIVYDHGTGTLTANAMAFYTAGNEVGRFDAAGKLRLLMGDFGATPSSSNKGFEFRANGSTGGTLDCAITSTSNHTIINFDNGNGGVGTIQMNGSATAYNTSSDYRLKENVNYDFDATSRLKELKPARFNFKADADTTVDGFIAHEVSSVVPEAISGEKDAVKVWKEGEELPEGVSVGDNKLDADGNTIMDIQGIDQSKLVPLLVKTIQELEARITELENA